MLSRIEKNLKEVKERIARAADRAGRGSDEIKLVAVTKDVPVERIKEAIELGVKIIGENRAQEARAKYEEIGSLVEWHMVGHLQRNKVKRVLNIFDLIHSVDSLPLAKEIDRRALEMGKRADILIEVNTSGEESKFGIRPDEALDFMEEISEFASISLLGLMTMAPFVGNPEDARPYFKRLRELKEELTTRNSQLATKMKYLSMGMTQDFEVAIEEGANMVRIGTAIFGR